MCLFRAFDKREWKKELAVGVGYKIFTVNRKFNSSTNKWCVGRRYLTGVFKNSTKPRPMRKWLDARDFDEDPKTKTLCDTFDRRYKKGWHIWLKPPPPNFYDHVYKVKFLLPLAIGIQGGREVAVAEKMYIVGPYKRSKKVGV